MKSKVKKCIVVLTILVQSTIYAQNWSYYKGYPVNVSPWAADSDNLGNLYMLNSKREVWGKAGSNSWNKFPDFPVANFFDIMVNKNTGVVYLADEFKGLVFTANNGVFWQQAYLETNPVSALHEGILTLSNINNSNVFYGGGMSALYPFGPAIFRYTTNGTTVSNIQKIVFDPAPVINYDNIPDAILQTSDGSKILIGTVANGIWISTNGGSTFQNILPGNQVYKIVSGPDNSFYALIRNISTNENQLLKSGDGVTWLPFYTNPDPNDNLITLYFDDALINLWLGTEKIIYKISDLNSPTPSFESQNLNNTEQRVVAIVKSSGTIHQFSSEFIAQKLVDSSWNSEINGLIGSSSEALFDTNNTLYSLDSASPVISKSTNSGTTDWMNLYIPGNIQAGVQKLNKDENGNIFFTKMNKLFRMNSSNNLQEINVPNPNAVFISRLFVAPGGNIYLTHNNETNKLYRSINGGETWQLLFESNWFNTYSSLCEKDEDIIFFTLMSNQAELHYSFDNGQNWNIFNYDFNSDLECGSATVSSIYRSGDLIFFNVCLKTFLLQFNDNEISLTEINFPNNAFPSHLLSNENGIYTVSDDEVIYKSSDIGQTWTSMGKPAALSPFPNSVYPLLMTNQDNEVFVQTSSYAFNLPENLRGFYKLTETLNLPEHKNFEVIIYPNPATDFINVLSKEVIADYQLYDIFGKSVNLKPVINNSIDISHLATGIYFLKLKSVDGKQRIFKIIKD